MSTEIENAIDAYLTAQGVKYQCRLVGETKREDWLCDAWRVGFVKAGIAPFEADYYTGTGHRVCKVKPGSRHNLQSAHELARWKKENAKPVAPPAAGVLHSLTLDASADDMSFRNWCDDYGYDSDSRKALATYDACCENARRMKAFFTRDQLATLAEMLQEY